MALPSDGAETLQLAPQLSLKSEPESERILAVGGIKQPKRHIPRIRDPPDLDTEEQEIRIRHQLETIRNKLRALLQICASDPQERAEEHTRNIEILHKQLKNVRQRQENLRQKLVQSKCRRQKIQNDGRINASASYNRNSSTVRMEELRDLNKSALTSEEARTRDCELQSRRRTIVSGGLVGFKVAADLRRQDFTDLESSADRPCKLKP